MTPVAWTPRGPMLRGMTTANAQRDALSDPLPADPMPTLRAWLEDATLRAVTPNPNAMTLATADAEGRPSARIVLCKDLDAARGRILFYTNRRSRKGSELAANPHAALLFHWDALDRQGRVEGPVTLLPDEESDAYFASRPLESRIGAWASEQTRPIESREALLRQVEAVRERFGVDAKGEDAHIPRPPHWGGYAVWAQHVELWSGKPARIHDRARWTRDLEAAGEGEFRGGAWTVARLQP